MCTFEEMIRKEGKKEGFKEGFREGFKEGFREAQLTMYVNMKQANCDDDTICFMFGITLQKLQQFKKRLSRETALTPKTV